MGKGIFKSPPNVHTNTTYQKLIKNSIKKSIFQSISKTPQTDLECALFETRIKLEEELKSIQDKVPNWNTQHRQNTLLLTIAILLSNEPTNEELIDRPLDVNKPQLLEFILHNMKEDTIAYSKKEKNNFINTQNELKTTLQNLISDPESEENTINIHKTQENLEHLENKLLYDTLSKKANFNLLHNEKPTKTFLSMEDSKQGYSEITMLRIINRNTVKTSSAGSATLGDTS